MGRIAFNLILLAACTYLYFSSHYLAAALCAAGLMYSVLQHRIRRIVSLLSRLESLPAECGCNTVLICRFSVEKSLSHPCVESLFQSLKAQGKVQAEELGGWIGSLVDNYKRKYKRDNPSEEVCFNIKSNLLFKNNEVDFSDCLYHEVSIPYEYVEGQHEARDMFLRRDEVELKVRVLVVNGMLLLQLGEFCKEHSPKVLKGGSVATYQTWVTLAAFPLMYFSHRHALPVRYLNLTSYAMDSSKPSQSSASKKEQRPWWRRTPSAYATRRAELQTLQQEVAAYRHLCDDDSGEYSWSAVEKLSKRFAAKRDELLKRGGFKKTWGSDRNDEFWRYPDSGEDYGNEYMRVSFRNLNLSADFAKIHLYTDYYEEEP